MLLLKALGQAVSMYSVLPVPGLRWEPRADKHMLALYPVVGLLLGGLWYGGVWLLGWLAPPDLVGAALTAVLPFLLTGFLHLDGFMDVCDAVLSRRDKERRLEILRDSHCGAFAVLSVIVLFLLQFASASALWQSPSVRLLFLLIPVLSRGLTAFALLTLPTLPGSSMAAWLKQDTGRGHRAVALCAALAAAVLLGVFAGWAGMIGALATLTGFGLALLTAYRSLGGVSGDTSGFAMTIAEAAGLLVPALLVRFL